MQKMGHDKQSILLFVWAAFYILNSPLLNYAGTSRTDIQDKVLKSIKEQAASWVQLQRVVGTEILIMQKGNIIFHEAFGWQDRERNIPMEVNTIFRIRSMTKPIVGTAILMLADQGSLKLSDPVAKYLPSFDNDRSNAITITQLLHHSSGFSDPGYPRSINSYGNLREAVDALGAKGPDTEPGSEFIYSDGGTATLGALVAEVSKMPVERFIEKYLILPLGMADTMTFLSPDDPRRPRVSCTYELEESGEGFIKYWDNTEPQKLPFFRASGGIYSTPVDYAKFLTMWMNGGVVEGRRYLSEQKVKDAFSSGIIPQYGMHWNLLWKEPDQDSEETAKAFSGFGHLGSDGTLAFAFPKKEIMIFYFSQSRGGSTSTEFLKMSREQLIY